MAGRDGRARAEPTERTQTGGAGNVSLVRQSQCCIERGIYHCFDDFSYGAPASKKIFSGGSCHEFIYLIFRTATCRTRGSTTVTHRCAETSGIQSRDRDNHGRATARARCRCLMGEGAAKREHGGCLLRPRRRNEPGCSQGAERLRRQGALSRRRHRRRVEGAEGTARPQTRGGEYAVGHTRAAQDRSHRLPVAHRAVRR